MRSKIVAFSFLLAVVTTGFLPKLYWVPFPDAATPTDDLYTGIPGESIKFGDSTALTALQDIVDTMDEEEWREIPNTLIPLTTNAEIDAITAANPTTDPIRGSGGPSSVIKAYSSAAYDKVRGHWYFMGGGHADYGGNEVFRFDLTTLTWERLRELEPLIGVDEADPNQTTEGITCKAPLDTPLVPHTWDGLMWNPIQDELWLFTSRGYCQPGGRAQIQESWWSFSPSTKEWEKHLTPTYGYDCASATWLENRSFAYVRPNNCTYDTKGLWIGPRFYASDGSLVYSGSVNGAGSGHNAAYYPIDDIMLLAYFSGLWKQDLNEMGALESVLSGWPQEVIDGLGMTTNPHTAGWQYRTETEKFVLWGGERGVVEYDPATTLFNVIPNTASAAAPTAPIQWVYDHWQYIESLDVFVGYQNVDQGVWIYKPTNYNAPIGDYTNCVEYQAIYGNDPCVELTTADTLQSKVAEIPASGGTVLVMPGTHIINLVPSLGGYSWLNIIGILNTQGERPVFQNTVTILQTSGATGCLNDDLVTADSGCTFQVKNLYFDAKHNGIRNTCLNTGSKTHRQITKIDNVIADGCSRLLMANFEYPLTNPETAVFNDKVYITNSTCFDSSSHCVYIDRVAESYVSDSKFYWSGNSHPFKNVAIYSEVDGIYAGNVHPTTEELNPDPYPSYPAYGHTPVSMVTCQSGFIRNSSFKQLYATGDSLGDIAGIAFQVRHDIYACDQPNYFSAEFWSEYYWNTPDSFSKEVSGNTFTILGDDRTIALTAVSIITTAPISVIDQTSAYMFLNKPIWWVERSYTTLSGNTYNNFDANDVSCRSGVAGAMATQEVIETAGYVYYEPPPQSEIDKMCVVQ